jgi:hypothetical protein
MKVVKICQSFGYTSNEMIAVIQTKSGHWYVAGSVTRGISWSEKPFLVS